MPLGLKLLASTTLLVVTLTTAVLAGKNSCGFDITRTLGTRTPYFDQRGDEFSPVPTLPEPPTQGAPDAAAYTLVQVQQVVRHGTRYPTKGTIETIQRLLARLQEQHAAVIPAWLRTYALPYNVSVEGQLAATGFKELEGLGIRTRAAVGDSLPKEFTSDRFVVQHTYKSRTKDSAKAFAKTFFANAQDVKYTEKPKKQDFTLRFFDLCPRYDRDVKDNKNATIELRRFRNSTTIGQHVEALRSSLGLGAADKLAYGDLWSVYSACAFDIALTGTEDHWCTLLTPEMIQTVEFAEDLEVFYEESHGFPINYEIATPLLRDIYQTMNGLVEGKSAIVGSFRFAHVETTLPFMTLLGYANSTPLLADFTNTQILQRKFRTSRLGLFMSNVEIRLYRARGDGKKHFVQARVNEQVAAIPGCNGKLFCELETVEKLWSKYLFDYDFEAACKI